MKMTKYVGMGAIGLALVAVNGCYEYQAPVSGTLGETYTQRQRADADKLLDGITNLTLADAQRIAVINNPTFIAASHAVNAARMRYYQAIGAYSPTLGVDFTLQNSHSWTKNTHNVPSNPQRTDHFNISTGVNANWLVFDSLAREFNVKASSHSLDYQRMLEADECRLLMQAVSSAYNQVLLAIENKRIALEDRDFQQSSLQYTQMKYQVGSVPKGDVLNFEILVNSAESNLVAADNQYETAVYALAVLMGYPDGSLPREIKFASDFKNYVSTPPAVEVYLDTALANRPDLKAYREQLEIAKYQMYQTYSAFGPSINLFANFGVGYQYNTNVGSDRYEAQADYRRHNRSTTPSFNYGVTADWMIFNGFIRYNQMREYQANLAVADYQAAAKWMSVVEEVRTAYSNYIQSVKQTAIFEKIRDLSAEQRTLVDSEYRGGNVELTRLNEAQRNLVEAETNLASSYINIQNAKAQLDAAVAAPLANSQRDTGDYVSPAVPAAGQDAQPSTDLNSTDPAQSAKPVKMPDSNTKAPATTSVSIKNPAPVPAKSQAPAAVSPVKPEPVVIPPSSMAPPPSK